MTYFIMLQDYPNHSTQYLSEIYVFRQTTSFNLGVQRGGKRSTDLKMFLSIQCKISSNQIRMPFYVALISLGSSEFYMQFLYINMVSQQKCIYIALSCNPLALDYWYTWHCSHVIHDQYFWTDQGYM